MREIKCTITGDVQGVFYRAFAKRLADEYRITGTIENMGNGSVEVFAQGHENTLKEYIAHLGVGSEGARVERVEVEWRNVHDEYLTFTII